jgi:hypothetical protein
VTAPTEGDTDHVTAVLLDPVTVPVNCCVCPALNVADVGETVIVTGVSVTVALAFFVASAALVAVTVTVCDELMLEGAV